MRALGLIALLGACSFTPGVLAGDDARGPDPDRDARVIDSPSGPSDAAPADTQTALPNCPASYVAIHGTSKYRVGTGTWYEAQEACADEGTHLVVIQSQSENAFVRSLRPQGKIWIGMSDHLQEQTFRWIDGSDVTGGFDHWEQGQPDDAGGSEDCGAMKVGGGWEDLNCTSSHAFVCECDGASPPIQQTWCQTGLTRSCNTCDDDCDAKIDEDAACNAMQQCFEDD